jgi:hypothetical protein
MVAKGLRVGKPVMVLVLVDRSMDVLLDEELDLRRLDMGNYLRLLWCRTQRQVFSNCNPVPAELKTRVRVWGGGRKLPRKLSCIRIVNYLTLYKR